MPPTSLDRISLQLLNSLPEAVVVTDLAGTIQFINAAARRMFAIAESEKAAGSIASLISPEQSIPQGQDFRHYLIPRDQAFDNEVFAARRDGSIFPALFLFEESEINDQPLLFISVRDLSLQNQQDEQAILLESRLSTAQRIARLGNWDWHIPSGDLWWSHEIYNIFGYDNRDFGATYQAFLDAVHQEDREMVESSVAEAIANRSLYSIRHRIVRPDGSMRIVQEQGEVEYDADNKPLAMHGTVQDVTDQVVIEQQLHKAIRLESVGRLTAGIAHDFNNLLGIIIGNLGILRLSLDAEKETKLLDTALNAAEKGSSLVNRLLSFSKSQPLNTEKVDIGQLTLGMNDLISRTLPTSINTHFDIVEQPCCCEIDASQLESAILNLTINAIDAMPEGGKLNYRVHHDQYAVETYLGGTKIAPGSYVTLEVEDSGTGISDDILERILEPFFTTKEEGKGTGLGLSMVYGFVEQSGGFLCINTELGTGTTIKLLFPESPASS